MQIVKFSILLFFLGLAIAAPAQNLLEDGRRLLRALETLDDSARAPETRDSAVWEVLLILALYGDPAHLQPLVLLEVIAGDFDDIILLDETYQDSVEMLGEREDKILQVERRMADVEQRIGRVKEVGLLSPEALAQFTQLTLNDFFALKKASRNLEPGEKPDSMHLFNVVTLGLQTINRVLELPLFADPIKPQTFVSLTQKYPALQCVPDISECCMNFLYYLETKQYRPAVSSMIRLLTSLSKQLDFTEKEKRQKSGITPADNRKTLFNFFETYGDFIAGLVDARTKDEVEYLLKSLADPPGSSRTKRTHRVTAGLNAYLGFSIGDMDARSLRPNPA